ncbi:hypothetical protein FOXYS1_6513 [Fusarium oxysporum]|uniref:Protein kinase domain-containing protein n=1 Tax=Fusarium oxysporum TaxID=5507 RepID=A0A8H5ACR9_FUSOX|nr:hypothetical protein FOXYS1_6513 [Fusarium oxysporum]
MSGLEALRAAASIIGVVGALKTCIDLLDIISTARGADLELEHLLVHLQWQRIRFYCWVQETGFTEAIIQDDERPAMQASDMLAFIQDDFRRGHILSHIQSSKINTTSDIGTGQFGRQYSLMAQLLESKHQTEVLERDQPKPVDMSNNEHVEALTLAPTIAASQASLNLRASEVRFGRRGTEGFRTREFSSRETSPLIIEWRHYSSEETRETRSSIDIRVHMLAMQLQQLSALHHTGVLPCLGYFHDPKCYRYGIAFHYPRGDSAASPTSLADRLNQDQPRRIRRDLGDRLRAAHSLTGTVHQMLSVNWLHKSISSSNVLLFEVERDSYTVETPFLCGFDLTRRDNDMEPSGKLPSIYLNNFPSLNERLYWHPTRTAAVPDLTASAVGYTLPLTRYRRELDIYSLGVVLLEIGLWYPIKRIFKDCQTEDLGVFSEQLKAKYVPELRGRMGRVYADVVVNCLKGNFGEGYIPLHDGSESSAEDDKELRRRRFLEDFERKKYPPYLAVKDRPHITGDNDIAKWTCS